MILSGTTTCWYSEALHTSSQRLRIKRSEQLRRFPSIFLRHFILAFPICFLTTCKCQAGYTATSRSYGRKAKASLTNGRTDGHTLSQSPFVGNEDIISRRNLFFFSFSFLFFFFLILIDNMVISLSINPFTSCISGSSAIPYLRIHDLWPSLRRCDFHDISLKKCRCRTLKNH